VKPLFAFRGLVHDAQRVLTAIHRFTLMGVELRSQFGFDIIHQRLAGLELSITAFTYADGRRRGFLYDSQESVRHVASLAHREERS
jgi:hypothetical protein